MDTPEPDTAFDRQFVRNMVESALRSAKQAEEYGMPANRIILSTKVSEVRDTAYCPSVCTRFVVGVGCCQKLREVDRLCEVLQQRMVVSDHNQR